MSITEAIFARRAVCDLTTEPVSEPTVHALLYAAIQPPNILDKETRSFVVVQNKAILKTLGDAANIAVDAGALIIVYAQSAAAFAEADSWMSVQNISLAAAGMGLGTRVVTEVLTVLNTPDWKLRLDVPETLIAVVPVLIGSPLPDAGVHPRRPPDILNWIA